MEILLSILGFIVLSSEILPFIKSIKSNGIIDLLINSTKKLFNKNLSVSNEEYTPLLAVSRNTTDLVKINIAENESFNHNDIYQQNIDTINNLNKSLEQFENVISNLINVSNCQLQTKEQYELEFIIDYIKCNYPKKMFQTRFLSPFNKDLLITKGYIIDYDSHDDVYIIKW